MLLAAFARSTIKEYQADQKQQYLDIDNPDFVCDFQLNLELVVEHTSTHIIFPTTIKLVKGPSANLFPQNDLNAVYNNLTELWTQNTNDMDSISKVIQIQSIKEWHTKLLALCFFILIFIIACFFVAGNSDLTILFVCVFFALVIYTVWYYMFHYPSKLNKIRSIWRKQFVDLVVKYTDQLQSNYTINNTENDFRFAILYPQTRSSGVEIGNNWLYLRITNGASNHKGCNLFYVPEIRFIEEMHPINGHNKGDHMMENDGEEGLQFTNKIVNSGKPIVSNLECPLLSD